MYIGTLKNHVICLMTEGNCRQLTYLLSKTSDNIYLPPLKLQRSNFFLHYGTPCKFPSRIILFLLEILRFYVVFIKNKFEKRCKGQFCSFAFTLSPQPQSSIASNNVQHIDAKN